MKILKLIIKDYQQFKHLELDFTHPETGEPLDKICFIGRNATGKSTILELLNRQLLSKSFPDNLFVFEILIKNNKYIIAHFRSHSIILPASIKNFGNWLSFLQQKEFYVAYNEWFEGNDVEYSEEGIEFIKECLSIGISYSVSLLQNNNSDLLIYCPPESPENSYLFDDIPDISLNEAMELFKYFSFSNEVSENTIKDFWRLLVFNIKNREDLFKTFAENNDDKSYKYLKEAFNRENNDILFEISRLWSKILEKANLYFDYEHAKIPIQLTDNLKAYIRVKSNNEIVPYHKLSTGIRNFVFKIGHIYSLYFNRKIERGFLLVDEPENSLFPDFLYDLIDEVYCKIIENQNTQFFVSTHNPIIAAQFEPYERIILDFDDEGFVFAKKGTVPVGDDPNDILFKDFGMRSLLTLKGQEKYKRFLQLEELVKNETDAKKRIELMKEYLQIGTDYNFAENEILTKE